MNALLDRFCRLLDALMVLLLAAMVVLVFGNVVLRYAFDSGITVSEEMSRWLFVWMTFLGAIVAIKEHGHLGSDMLVSRLPPKGQKALLVVGHLLMLYITWLLFQGSLAQVRINADTGLRDDSSNITEYFLAEFPPAGRSESFGPSPAAAPGRSAPDVRDQLF